jgi:hypothetical protein
MEEIMKCKAKITGRIHTGKAMTLVWTVIWGEEEYFPKYTGNNSQKNGIASN